MGNCCSTNSYQTLSYPKTITISIKSDKKGQKLIPPEQSTFTATLPIKLASSINSISSYNFKTSYCIVPGQDPRRLLTKTCQDNIFISKKPGFMLITLFDGHGSKAEEIVKFAENYMSSYFLKADFTTANCKSFLEEMYINCDVELLSPTSKIDAFGAGTTAVSVLLTESGIYTASVGDSRAILATIVHDKNRHTHRNVDAIQLTVDQKPNLESEMLRILNSGGIVCKAKNNNGDCQGPYRVYQKGKEIPGLAMSRSLGDAAAKRVGVIATPMIDFYPLLSTKDQFIVIASDGLWASMSNKAVVDFVENFRRDCKNECTEDSSVRSNNSTISRLLIEEARSKWVSRCTEEDIVIDDISAAVIEIFSNELQLSEENSDAVYRESQNLGSYIELDSE